MLHLYILVNNIVFVSISVIIGIDRHTGTVLTMKVIYKYNIRDLVLQIDRHTGTLLIMKVIYKYNIRDLILQWDKSPA